jgi:spermidine synthase
MAIIWQYTNDKDHYEVRKAGASIRLYSNGVFHSQYNPKQKLSNSIWDLLILPLFFYPRDKIKRILLLGVGGGAAINLLHHYIEPEHIVGIELNSIHLKVARQYFNIKKQQAELICEDATIWLKDYSGPPFDMIIDDLFGHKDGETLRAVKLDSAWMTLLNRNLSKQGILVANTAELADFRESGFMKNQRIRSMFKTSYKLTHPTCANRVFAFCKADENLKNLKQNIDRIPNRLTRQALLKLALRMRKYAPAVK